MSQPYLVSAESVTEGHPDKVCDQISDSILDACLQQDPDSRVAAEVLACGNTLHIAGEITTTASINVAEEARSVMRKIGYTDPALGFDAESCFILTDIHTQSPDIACGVSQGDVLGAGDQGVFYGFACNETDSYMATPIALAHALSKRLASVRHGNLVPWLRPDGKTQVTVRYENDRPVCLESLVVSAQHAPDVEMRELVENILEHVVFAEVDPSWITEHTRVLINPTGRFVEGGPAADTGLTGRKLMVDTYGGGARHGGGAFSGKDATKVDRSAAYMARYVAKNIVAAGLASRCEVSIAYAIGQPYPEMVNINTFGSNKVDISRMTSVVRDVFPFSVAGMIEELSLRKPQFLHTAAYGHFGQNTEGFAWEKTDKAELLRSFF